MASVTWANVDFLASRQLLWPLKYKSALKTTGQEEGQAGLCFHRDTVWVSFCSRKLTLPIGLSRHHLHKVDLSFNELVYRLFAVSAFTFICY